MLTLHSLVSSIYAVLFLLHFLYISIVSFFSALTNDATMFEYVFSAIVTESEAFLPQQNNRKYKNNNTRSSTHSRSLEWLLLLLLFLLLLFFLLLLVLVLLHPCAS